jgi:hypothetical protein
MAQVMSASSVLRRIHLSKLVGNHRRVVLHGQWLADPTAGGIDCHCDVDMAVRVDPDCHQFGVLIVWPSRMRGTSGEGGRSRSAVRSLSRCGHVRTFRCLGPRSKCAAKMLAEVSIRRSVRRRRTSLNGCREAGRAWWLGSCVRPAVAIAEGYPAPMIKSPSLSCWRGVSSCWRGVSGLS